jgi:hypothetical protein
MFEHFTFSPILYHPLQFALRSVLFGSGHKLATAASKLKEASLCKIIED